MLHDSPQAEAIELFTTVDDAARGSYEVVASPWTFEGLGKPTPTPAPAIDEHRGIVLGTFVRA